jgi:hypothetical protein
MSDLISRDAVIKAMENNSHMVEVFGTKIKMIDAMMMCCEIADLPTIKAVPVVKAEWEECDWVAYDWSGECVRYPRKAMKCSNCSNAFKKELLWKHNFCPNCGADMQKGGAE